MLQYHEMTAKEKETVAAWNDTGDYEIYNMLSYQQQLEQGIAFGAPGVIGILFSITMGTN